MRKALSVVSEGTTTSDMAVCHMQFSWKMWRHVFWDTIGTGESAMILEGVLATTRVSRVTVRGLVSLSEVEVEELELEFLLWAV